jgi:hypothetical protein
LHRIEDPAKKAKHSLSFAVYGDEVYDKARADALEADPSRIYS